MVGDGDGDVVISGAGVVSVCVGVGDGVDVTLDGSSPHDESTISATAIVSVPRISSLLTMTR
jgi:hypothetical protein